VLRGKLETARNKLGKCLRKLQRKPQQIPVLFWRPASRSQLLQQPMAREKLPCLSDTLLQMPQSLQGELQLLQRLLQA